MLATGPPGPVTSDKTPALRLCRKKFPPRQKVVKHVKCLLGGKVVRVDRHPGGLRERESYPRGSLNHLYGALLLGFLWPIVLLCLVLSPYLVHLRLLPCVRLHLLATMNSSEEAYG